MQYGKHALALDENRADFDRVRWGEPHSTRAERDRLGNKTFEQVWFAGNHSDVGGGYSENESRLSDIALEWMINAAIAVPHPIKIDRSVLHVHPDPTGMQHDECKAGITYVTRYTGKTWKLQHRALPGPKTTIDNSVRQRFEAGPVLQCDRVLPYRPENVRIVDAYKAYFEKLPNSECGCATCRQIRGLPPLPTLKSRLAKRQTHQPPASSVVELSTTRRCPSLLPSFSATTRAVTSPTPPAANGRTSRGGFVGYLACAKAERVRAGNPNTGSAAIPSVKLRRFTPHLV